MIKKVLVFHKIDTDMYGDQRGNFIYAVKIFGFCIYVTQINNVRVSEMYELFGETLVNKSAYDNSLPRFFAPPPSSKQPLCPPIIPVTEDDAEMKGL